MVDLLRRSIEMLQDYFDDLSMTPGTWKGQRISLIHGHCYDPGG